MAASIRRGRLVTIAAALVLCIAFYSIFRNAGPLTSPPPPAQINHIDHVPHAPHVSPRPPQPPETTPSTPKRWKKLPERYPVDHLTPIPTSPAVDIPAIQLSTAPPEDATARQTRLARRAAVKESFEHGWQGYKAHAWLSDEVGPLTGEPKNAYGGWAATLVDALDTLWMMGLRDEFEQAVDALHRIDFTTSPVDRINVFETTIRYLGGFLAAYELTDGAYPVLLEKATEVGELLMSAFDTPNRMPVSRWNWHSYMMGIPQVAPSQTLASELGSLCLEFTKLSQLTGDMKYYDAVQRIADQLEQSQDRTKLPGMWPIVVDLADLAFDKSSSFTLGGMSDSLYEYLPKQYLLLGGALQQPRTMYEKFITVARQHLFRRVLNDAHQPLVVSGDVSVFLENGKPEIATTPRGQHLTCFAGGMVGLSARLFRRPSDLDLATQLTDACVWSYNITITGIGPEIFQFVPCGDAIDAPSTETDCAYTPAKWHSAIKAHWHLLRRDPASADARTADLIRAHHLVPGIVDWPDKRYILRPEAVESVFILYRLTGDRVWTDKAWHMFQRIDALTRTPIAAASLDDVVAKERPGKRDSMESFWLAETLKYFYLIFDEWHAVDLNEWVLNTEAHPLRRVDLAPGAIPG